MDSENKNHNLDNGCSIEKQILVVFSKTIAIILVLCFATVFYLSLFAPNTMAKFTYDMGMKNVSFYYSKVQYLRDNNINSLYTVVNKSIELKKYKDIEKYCNQLFSRQNYYDFVTFIENENIISVGTSDNGSFDKLNLMISMANEDMYLKNKYVGALIMNGKTSEALEFANLDFSMLTHPITLQSRIHWCYTNLFLLDDIAFLDDEQKSRILAYINEAYSLYLTTDYDTLDVNNKFNYAILENTLKRNLNDLLNLQNKGVMFSDLSYDDIKNMIKVLNGGE